MHYLDPCLEECTGWFLCLFFEEAEGGVHVVHIGYLAV